MKIRNGFVSNSSSSSFCVLGMRTSELKNYLPNMEETEDFGIDDYIESKADDDSLNCHRGIENYCEDYVVGLDVDSLDEDKTINQLKKDLAEKMSRLFDIELTADNISFYIDGGYDG